MPVVSVAARLRPLTDAERAAGARANFAVRGGDAVEDKARGLSHRFAPRAALAPASATEELYAMTVGQLVAEVGRGGVVLATGPPGGGKSRALLGAAASGLPAADADDDGGVVLVTAAACLDCLLYTSPSPRDGLLSRMPSSA